jgi:hypothetical protein
MNLVAGCQGFSSPPGRTRTAVRHFFVAATALILTAAAGTLEAQQAAPLNAPPASDEAVRAFRRRLDVIADPQVRVEAQKVRAINLARMRAQNIARMQARWGGQPVEGQQSSGTLLMQLEVEMAFVRRVCSPPLDQVDEIRKDLKKCLLDGAQGPAPVPCEVLQERLVDAVALHLSRSEAAFYRAEVQKRRNHERAACVDTFVVLLDQQMNFTEKQRQALVAALLPKWKPDWSQTVEVACATGDTTMPEVPNELIEPLLDAEQITIWKGWPKNGRAHPPFNPARIGSTGVTAAVPMDQ